MLFKTPTSSAPCARGPYLAMQTAQSVYFFLNQLALFLVSGGMELDMAEQVWLSDRYAWVYGTQPPLYTWITRLLLGLFGGSLLPMYLFKAGLLSLLVGALLAVGYRARFSAAQLLAVLAGVFLNPMVSWEAQRDLTHTALATAVAAWLLHEGMKIGARGAADIVRTALLLAAGMLSKYNFILFAVVWLFVRSRDAQAGGPYFRQQALIAALMAVCLFAPQLTAASRALDTWLDSADKFELGQGSRWSGMADAVGSMLMMLAPLVVLMLVEGVRDFAASVRAASVHVAPRLLIKLLRASAGAVLLLTFVSGATEIRERWLLPLFFHVPLVVASLLPQAPPRFAARYVRAGFAAAIAMMMLLPARVVAADWLGSHNRLNLPYRELMLEVAAHSPAPSFLIVDSILLAGHARLAFPDAEIFVYGRPPHQSVPHGEGLLVGRLDVKAPDAFQTWMDRMELHPESRHEMRRPLYHSDRKTAGVWWARIRLEGPIHFAAAAPDASFDSRAIARSRADDHARVRADSIFL